MTNTRSRTPFPSLDTLVVTDAGLETWLVFDRGIDLPAFAAYPLALSTEGRALLTEYYGHYASIAERLNTALVLEAPTWRANPDWAATLGHDLTALRHVITESVDVVDAVRSRWTGNQPFLISGAVGPRGDGYRIDVAMDADTATEYHSFQIACMASTPIDVVTAMTIGYADEAIGITRAAQQVGLPVVISFTVETDGRLPSGISVQEAIEVTDAATGSYPLHYMINCAHPTHFDHLFNTESSWAARIGGLRANASMLSHAELDEMVELDAGDPADLANRYVALRSIMPALQVIGGCCGTDHRHVEALASACVASR